MRCVLRVSMVCLDVLSIYLTHASHYLKSTQIQHTRKITHAHIHTHLTRCHRHETAQYTTLDALRAMLRALHTTPGPAERRFVPRGPEARGIKGWRFACFSAVGASSPLQVGVPSAACARDSAFAVATTR